jgi:ribonucleoside-diphosphate reductase alpha chain
MTDIEKKLQKLKNNGEAPEWMTLAGYTTLSRGYMLEGETPRDMYWRVAWSAARYFFKAKRKGIKSFFKMKKFKGLNERDLAWAFMEAMWNNWMCPASPVLSNLGTNRGLPISCYGNDVGDSVKRIMECASELALLGLMELLKGLFRLLRYTMLLYLASLKIQEEVLVLSI